MNEKLVVVASAVAIALVGLSTSVAQNVPLPLQGEGDLSQSPLNLGTGATPAFIMAVDDSGSMLFQTMFPGANGEGCWSTSSRSFFVENNQGQSTGELRTSGSCDYLYVVPGPRNSTNDRGIPPLDTLGFARSPDFNPSYFDPAVTYLPWIDDDLEPYDDAGVNNTRIHPDRNDSVRLFGNLKSTEWTFTIQTGMVIPGNTEYNRRDGSCDQWNRWGQCTRRDWGNWRKSNSSFTWNSGAEEIAIAHIPGVVYLREEGKPPGYAEGGRIADACGEGCSLWKYTPESNAAQQNYANWFSFYGNRNRAMIAGMTRAMRDVDKLRVGYLTINDNANWDQPLTRARERVDMFDMDSVDEKSRFYREQLLTLPASGGTPNLPAVNAAGEQFRRTDGNAPVMQSCQKNTVMLFTDGYSNVAHTVANQDGAMGAPFADNHSNTMADIATRFYRDNGNASPIRPDMRAGQVRVPAECNGPNPDPSLDCQSNLHVNFYGITLGATGDLFDPDLPIADQNPYTTPAIFNNWPAYLADTPSTIDDIWHATVNTRGRFINATTPADITRAMREVLGAAGADAGQAGSLAVSGARLGDDSFSVTPSYGANGTDWFGDLTASRLQMSGGAVTRTTLWNAADNLPAAGARNIFFARTDADSTPEVRSFTAANVGDLELLCDAEDPLVPAACARVGDLGVSVNDAVQYLRGDDRLEETTLRTRTNALGDIINSTPMVSSPRDNYGYSALMANPNGGQPANDPFDYAGYLEDKAARPTMVYVGANDGMLHAFDNENGREAFAYIPATAVGHMGGLLFPEGADFEHRYFVDGPIAISDAFYSGAWHTVLVGTAGAGGRGVFGLDIDNPGGFAAGNVLWEVNDRMENDAAQRIGHVTSRPVIVPVRETDGTVEWKAIFGNGFGSDIGANGTVTLFVVDIATGEIEFIDARAAVVPDGSNGGARPNGMSSIIALDRQQVGAGGAVLEGSDGFVDTVYGADLHGNVWRFDLLLDEVAFDGVPLFTAERNGIRQPITGGLEAALGPRGGVMVLFGTGSFMFENDKLRNEVQSIYGILDAGAPVAGRGNLQQQVVNGDMVSTNDVNYFTQAGWFLDLDTQMPDPNGTMGPSGERMFSRPRLDNGTFWFSTFAPSSPDPCAGGGTNWGYGLSALTGGANMDSMRTANDAELPEGTGRMDLQTVDSAPVMDVGIYTTSPLGALVQGPTESDADFAARYAARLGADRCDVIVEFPGGEPLLRWRACGRQSWRQVR